MNDLLKNDGITYEEAYADEKFRPTVEKWSVNSLGYIMKPQYLYRNLIDKINKRSFSVEDFEKALSIIKNIDENILLVLQPITPLGGLHEAPPEKMLKWQTRAMQVLKNVRVIPQTHKMMNQL